LPSVPGALEGFEQRRSTQGEDPIRVATNSIDYKKGVETRMMTR